MSSLDYDHGPASADYLLYRVDARSCKEQSKTLEAVCLLNRNSAFYVLWSLLVEANLTLS